MTQGVQIRGLQRDYVSGVETLQILRGVDLELESGVGVAIVGRSGAGKSTLLHLLGLLDQPTAGSIRIDGVETVRAPRSVRDRLRRDHIGFVFQFYHLLEELNAEQNVLLSGMMNLGPVAWWRRRGAEIQRARELLDRVGLGDRLKHFPSRLSGGERQRVAIARALFRNPSLLLCDEPTGNLDEHTSLEVENLILDLHRERNMILVLVTHNLRLAHRLDRVYALESGHLHLVEGHQDDAAAVAASTL